MNSVNPSLTILPPDALRIIFGYLDWRDVILLKHMCRTLRDTANHCEAVWKQFFLRQFPDYPFIKEPTHWQHFFKRQWLLVYPNGPLWKCPLIYCPYVVQADQLNEWFGEQVKDKGCSTQEVRGVSNTLIGQGGFAYTLTTERRAIKKVDIHTKKILQSFAMENIQTFLQCGNRLVAAGLKYPFDPLSLCTIWNSDTGQVLSSRLLEGHEIELIVSSHVLFCICSNLRRSYKTVVLIDLAHISTIGRYACSSDTIKVDVEEGYILEKKDYNSFIAVNLRGRGTTWTKIAQISWCWLQKKLNYKLM